MFLIRNRRSGSHRATAGVKSSLTCGFKLLIAQIAMTSLSVVLAAGRFGYVAVGIFLLGYLAHFLAKCWLNGQWRSPAMKKLGIA